MISKTFLAALTAAGAMAAVPAHAAALTGDRVTCTGDARITCSPGTATVGNGVEFSTNRLLSVDFTATGLTISSGFFGENSFSGGVNDFVLRFSDLTRRFNSASLGASSSVSGFSAANFALDALGVLRVGMGGTTFRGFGSVSVNLTTAEPVVEPPQPPQPSAVPEPASWAMLMLGLGAVGGILRRRPAVARRTRPVAAAGRRAV